MLERYRSMIDAVDMSTADHALEMLGLLRLGSTSLYDALEEYAFSQADLVLCLLRLNTRASLRHASKIVGRPIVMCPPLLALARGPLPKAKARRFGDDRLVKTVKPIPAKTRRGHATLENSDMRRRMLIPRVGLSVRQLVARGMTRRDLRLAQRRGHLVLEREGAL